MNKVSDSIPKLDWPLMNDNILPIDREAVIEFLKRPERLTQGNQVRHFEQEWSKWVGVKHSVFVNSGSSANLITLAALREIAGLGEVIVPTLTWVSDIAAVLHCGFTPVFVDIDPQHLGMQDEQVLSKITSKTKAVFLTHILGFNGLSEKLVSRLREKNVPLIEDCCESHGAVFQGKRVGAHGWASNFSFYFAHHLSTIEGGMVCTNDDNLYQHLRMFRSHGLVREADDVNFRKKHHDQNPDLNEQFIFAFPAYNVRSTEINAVFGLSQLKRLDEEIIERNDLFQFFLKHLDARYFRTDFDLKGMSNYAFVLVLQKPDNNLCDRVMQAMNDAGVEFRRGTSGGGNQLRQPYLKKLFGEDYIKFPAVEHIHAYGFYIGNYPGLSKDKILKLCEMLNTVAVAT